jgi:dipeptidyl-peptidase-4
MRTLILIAAGAIFLVSAISGTAQNRQRLTLEAIFSGGLSATAPSELRWAPDGRRLAYVMAEGEGRALWVLDVVTGKRARILSPLQMREMAPSSDEASLGERERTRRDRYNVPSYCWGPDGNRILLTSSGRLFVYDLGSGASKLLTLSKSGLLDPIFSPDGKWISFVYMHDLWVVPSAGGEEKQLTFGGNSLLLHGELDWVYQEEFAVRIGYQWSPDSRYIAFLELDERAVPVYPIVEQMRLEATADLQRYPKAGDPNPRARVGIASIENMQTVWADGSAEYIPRIDWADGSAAVLQMLNRAQNELNLVEVNPETGTSRTILTERDANWLDVGRDLKFLAAGKRFLWTSDRTGFRHIYLYDRNGTLVRQITKGDWVVREIAGVDEEGGWIYYESNENSVLGRDLYRIREDATKAERVTIAPGTHSINMNPQATAHVDSFSSMNRMQEIRVRDLSSGKETELLLPKTLEQFELVAPEMSLLKAPDGAAIRVLLYKPQKPESTKKYPVLVYAYGMPGVPAIQDAWPGNRGLFHQFLVQHGFVVALVDDRSSAIPGHKYAVAAHHKIGPVAAQDHEVAVQYLKSLPYVNGDAMGIWGWSGGGFTATYHMMHTNLFKAGVAGAPVTDWRLYDSIYTERYMGLPAAVPEAYENVSSVAAAADYKGRLLLIHGMQDDNVHPQNTFQLVRALIRNKKQFDLMIYPDKTHGITGAAENTHLYTTIYEFLKRNLTDF